MHGAADLLATMILIPLFLAGLLCLAVEILAWVIVAFRKTVTIVATVLWAVRHPWQTLKYEIDLMRGR